MKLFLNYFMGALFLFSNTALAESPPAAATPENKMTLHTNAFQEKMAMPTLYTCDGKNISPELSWSNAPVNTSTFAIIMSDPDAPGGTFYHWVLYNIPNTVKTLTEGTPLAGGAHMGKNNFNKFDYSGPCPPKGSTHTYVITLYALDSKLTVPGDADAQTILSALKGHIITQTDLTSVYNRWTQ